MLQGNCLSRKLSTWLWTQVWSKTSTAYTNNAWWLRMRKMTNVITSRQSRITFKSTWLSRSTCLKTASLPCREMTAGLELNCHRWVRGNKCCSYNNYKLNSIKRLNLRVISMTWGRKKAMTTAKLIKRVTLQRTLPWSLRRKNCTYISRRTHGRTGRERTYRSCANLYKSACLRKLNKKNSKKIQSNRRIIKMHLMPHR